MNLTVQISRGGTIYQPAVLDGAVWETEAGGAPGRFVFPARDASALKMDEGDTVSATLDGKNVFYGYIFTRRYDQTGSVHVTAYDQMRYLKNRDTVVYGGITASELVLRAAGDHRLKTGAVSNTVLRLEPCAEDNKSLADILRNALARTWEAGGGRFILYDDFGALTLAKAGDMRRDLLVCAESGQTFSRSISIDRDTYNTVKLVCDTKDGRTVYAAADTGNQSKWGKLQYFEKIPDGFNGSVRAAELLKLYNRERRELVIGGVQGDLSVRAGCSLLISGDLTGKPGNTLCFVERARHVWKEGGYFMDLEVTYA
jgi:hypothetical protein